MIKPYADLPLFLEKAVNANLENDSFLVFNATFSNISAISWRPVLLVEEAGVPGENHRPWASIRLKETLNSDGRQFHQYK